MRDVMPQMPGASGLEVVAQRLFDQSLTWDALDWLKSITSLPIVVKGILTAEDAQLAVEHGAAGIIVSNHGGRQLDGVPATIEALPEVVEAVAGRCEVYLDGGVRRGTDVLKALALGARGVFVGPSGAMGAGGGWRGRGGARADALARRTGTGDGARGPSDAGEHRPDPGRAALARRG